MLFKVHIVFSKRKKPIRHTQTPRSVEKSGGSKKVGGGLKPNKMWFDWSLIGKFIAYLAKGAPNPLFYAVPDNIVCVQTAPFQLADEKDIIRHKGQREEKTVSDVCCLPDI